MLVLHGVGEEVAVAAGILTGTGVKGVYGKGPVFVATFEALDRFVTAAGRIDDPEVLRFPAVIPAGDLVCSDYLRSFPDLAGSIHGFEGGNREHAALMRKIADGAEQSDAEAVSGSGHRADGGRRFQPCYMKNIAPR